MIRVTHIERNHEERIVKEIYNFLKLKYPHYFEVKCYHDGPSKGPTFKLSYEGAKMNEHDLDKITGIFEQLERIASALEELNDNIIKINKDGVRVLK